MSDHSHRRKLVPRLLGSSRWGILFGVIGAFLSALMLLIYGVLVVFSTMIDTIRAGEISTDGAKGLAVDVIQMVDLFLLGTVVYIVALGLYELFIDDDLPIPAWLEIHSLDDLKSKLIGVVVLLLGVTFLGAAVSSKDSDQLLELGLAIGAVIVALTLSQTLTSGKRPKTDGSATRASDEDRVDVAAKETSHE
jgi:uncharacterized membrane protein YqhA